jgi:hypothetical protein
MQAFTVSDALISPNVRRMMSRMRGILAAAAAMATLMCIGSAIASQPAKAATQEYAVMSGDSLTCLQEDGTTSAVYLGNCTSNNSDIWTRSALAGYSWDNLHSGKCISVTGSDPGIYMNTCGTDTTTDTAQEWILSDCGTVNDIQFAGKDYSGLGCFVKNKHSGDYLWWAGGGNPSEVEQVSNTSSDEAQAEWFLLYL